MSVEASSRLKPYIILNTLANTKISIGLGFRAAAVLLLLNIFAAIFPSGFDGIPQCRAAENLQFRHIGEKEGLKYTWVNHISGDSRGYLWFSTMYGAFRYDGFTFKELQFHSDEGKLLRVTKIYEDSSEYVWVGTDGGLFRCSIHDGSRVKYSTGTDSRYRLSSDYIEDICSDINGNIWIAGSNGVDVILADGTFRSWRIGNVRSVMVDSRMRVWAAAGNRLMYLDDIEGDFMRFKRLGTRTGAILNLFMDSRNNIWISADRGLFRYSLSEKKTTVYNTASGTLPNDLVRQTIEDKNGDIWAATEHGLVRFHSGEPEFILAEGGNLWGLNDNAIYSLYCDADNNLWVGTFFGGVNVMYNHYRMFSFLLTYSEGFSASSRVVSSIVHCGDELIVGTENDGVHLFAENGGHIHYPAESSGLTSGNIHSVCRDRFGNLWAGSYRGGLFMMPKGSSRFSCVKAEDGSTAASSSAANSIYCILNDSTGNLWVGTRKGGLYRYDYLNGELKHIGGELPGNLFVWSIFEDSVGDIWLACYGDRIWKLSSSNGYAPLAVDSPVSTYISACELSDGRIAFCSESDGIVCVNPATLSCESVTSALELPDNTVYAILQDDSGSVWFSTNFGLCRTEPDFSSVTIYTIADGLPTNRFNYNSAEKYNGKLYFGSTNGLVIVNPQLAVETDIDRPILFNDLYVNNVRQSIDPHGSYSCNLNEIGVLKLEHWQNTFSIDFTNNMFGYDYGQMFAYRMQGADDSWHVLKSSSKIDFTGLAPGHYTLSVANFHDGKVMDNVSSLNIRIKPVWWQSTVAKICFAMMLIALAAWLCIMLTLSSRHRHELEIERLNREKDKEMNDMKLRFFVNISHEFKTPLSLILGPLEQFMKGRVPEGKRERYFSIIKMNADKLLALINELLSFRELQFAKLDLSEFSVEEMLKDVTSRYEWQFEEKGLSLTVNVPAGVKVEADRKKLEKIVDNLISNAFKHCSRGDGVTVSVSVSNDRLSFSVKDTGEGIPADKISHIFERFFTVKAYDMYSTGVGLSYVKSLVELHGGTISVSSELSVGTEFIFDIPLRQPAAELGEHVQTDDGYSNIQLPLPSSDINSESVLDREDYLKLAAETVILVVEDDTAMRDLLVDHFSRRYTVLSTDSGEGASRIVRESKVDVVISDVMLGGGMSGFELCHFIKNNIETSHIKVVLMTVLSEHDYKCHGYLSGADSYIVKPFTFSMMELVVKNLIVSAYMSREKFRKVEIDLGGIDIPSDDADEQLIRKISSVVLEHISDSELNVDALCQEIGMSKPTLYRKLKAVTGESINEFIQNFRLKYAARLLSDTTNPVSEIAYDVGFADPYYFSRAFKKLFDMSPKQWRQSHASDSKGNGAADKDSHASDSKESNNSDNPNN